MFFLRGGSKSRVMQVRYGLVKAGNAEPFSVAGI